MARRARKDRILDKDHPDILIHYSEDLIAEGKNPYVVIDDKGEILDDAQGYGYKTSQNARKAYIYKYISPGAFLNDVNKGGSFDSLQ